MPTSLLRVVPQILPKLDPDFRPAYLGNKHFVASAKKSGRAVPLILALERSHGAVTRYDTVCFPTGAAGSADNYAYAERILKFMLWARGGAKVFIHGPKEVVDQIKASYGRGGEREFDADFFAGVFGAKKFEVAYCADKARVPKASEKSRPVGRHLEGCRIGFDAGGSDRKVAAVIDGKQVFTTETVWHPKTSSDPQYHFDGIDDSIRQAAAHLPRIDAIGVSSAGIYVDNQVRVASLFRKVPKAQFDRKIKNIYLDIAKKWGHVPVEVANDGDVTALAGSMSLGDNAVLGIAMGTSQAVGYVDGLGHVTGWLNELAFAPVDYAERAPQDIEWSGDFGTGVNYFSQDAVIRLAPRIDLKLDPQAAPGEKLKHAQDKFKAGTRRVGDIFETIGTYLGYAILQYAEFYDLRHVLILGRVTSGEGGNLVLAKAREVLKVEDPVLARRISVTLPDEKSRRVGQAIAAASLPDIKKIKLGGAKPRKRGGRGSGKGRK